MLAVLADATRIVPIERQLPSVSVKFQDELEGDLFESLILASLRR